MSDDPAPAVVPGSPSVADVLGLAAEIVAKAAPAQPPLNAYGGTVVDTALTDSPPTASITMNGSATQIDDVRFMAGYTPVIGDTVEVLSQNGSILIIGHVMDTGTDTATTGGWTLATLSSGFSHNGDSQGNLFYRRVSDHGVWKMQWQGAVALSNSNTTVVTGLATSFRPASQRKLITARGMGNGAAILDVQVQFTTTGTVVLAGSSYDFPVDSHAHVLGFDDLRLSGYLSQGGSDLGHQHNMGTSFLGYGSITLSTPDWISFNGLEYFL